MYFIPFIFPQNKPFVSYLQISHKYRCLYLWRQIPNLFPGVEIKVKQLQIATVGPISLPIFVLQLASPSPAIGLSSALFFAFYTPIEITPPSTNSIWSFYDGKLVSFPGVGRGSTSVYSPSWNEAAAK